MSHWLKGLGWMVLLVLLAGCSEFEEVEKEVGYKGKARSNPWLAAERFAGEYGYAVESLTAWEAPEDDTAVWLVPASVLNNESFVRKAGTWAKEGGHLVVVLDHAGAEISDWRSFDTEVEVAEPLARMLEEAGIKLTQQEQKDLFKSWETKPLVIEFDDEKFRVEAGAGKQVAVDGGTPGVFASVRTGVGRISALADARIFRNRWIGNGDHAALLLALIDAADFEGAVRFSRGASLSLWGMLRRHLWAVLLGMAAVLVVWLWQTGVRFGPIESAQPPMATRSYAHHLEALGSYHWRVDRAGVLLGPLRERIFEQSLRLAPRVGRNTAEVQRWLAERSGLPVERVAAALDTGPPADAASLTRITADLQLLNQLTH